MLYSRMFFVEAPIIPEHDLPNFPLGKLIKIHSSETLYAGPIFLISSFCLSHFQQQWTLMVGRTTVLKEYWLKVQIGFDGFVCCYA